MNDTTNGTYFQINVTRDFAIVSMVFQTLFLVLGAPGNTLVCFFIFRNKKDIKLSDIMISMLAISDALYCIASYIFFFPAMYKASIGEVPVYPGPTANCRLEVAIPLYFGIVNIYCMTVLAITRYTAIVKPQRMIALRRRHGIFIISLLTWILPLIFTLPQIFGHWGGFSYIHNIGICLGVFHYTQGFETGSYYICLILFVIQFPTLLIGWCYYQIYLEVRNSRLRISQFRSSFDGNDASMTTNVPTPKRLKNSQTGNTNRSSTKRRERDSRKAEIAIAKTLLIVFITFQVSFMPYSIVSFINFFTYNANTVQLQLGLLFVTYIGNVANPYIFLVRSEKFQKFCRCRMGNCCQKGTFRVKVKPLRVSSEFSTHA